MRNLWPGLGQGNGQTYHGEEGEDCGSQGPRFLWGGDPSRPGPGACCARTASSVDKEGSVAQNASTLGHPQPVLELLFLRTFSDASLIFLSTLLGMASVGLVCLTSSERF